MAVEAAVPALAASMPAACTPVALEPAAARRAHVLVGVVIAAAVTVIAAVAASFPASSPVLWSAARWRQAPIMADLAIMAADRAIMAGRAITMTAMTAVPLRWPQVRSGAIISVAYCMQTYKSYDPQSGTYLGYDGQRHPCP